MCTALDASATSSPPWVPVPPPPIVLHRSAHLVVKTERGHVSFVLRGTEVEFFEPRRLQAVVLRSDLAGDGDQDVHLELRGIFRGATAYGSDPSRRLIGPLPFHDAQAAVTDLNRVLKLPQPVHEVTLQQLESDPERYAGQWVDVVVRWTVGFESSTCGDKMSIWFSPTEPPPPPPPGRPPRHSVRCRVVGRFEYAKRVGPGSGFGHMGVCRGALTASTMEPLPEPDAARVSPQPSEGHKAFSLGGHRIDFERHTGAYRVTVDGTPVAMTFEARETTTGNSGTSDPKVVKARTSVGAIDFGPVLGSRATFSGRADDPHRADCSWAQRLAEMYNTVIYEHHLVVLEFSEDWRSVKVTWTTDTDLSS